MARGKAIVVTDTPGVRDYIRDGETGLIVAPGDATAMGHAVTRLLEDPAERARIGSQARERALSELTLTRYATRLLEVVDETPGGSGAASLTERERLLAAGEAHLGDVAVAAAGERADAGDAGDSAAGVGGRRMGELGQVPGAKQVLITRSLFSGMTRPL